MKNKNDENHLRPHSERSSSSIDEDMFTIMWSVAIYSLIDGKWDLDLKKPKLKYAQLHL
jgi:hypothetical protein